MIKGLSSRLRDRTALLFGGAVIALILLAGGFAAAGVALKNLDRTIAARSQGLRAIEKLRGEAQNLQQRLQFAEAKLAKAQGGTVVPVIEGLANRIAGQGNLVYLRPLATSTRDDLQVEAVEFKLERQSYEQVLRLIWETENSPAAPMRITGLRLQRRFENHALLDATVTMNAYRK